MSPGEMVFAVFPVNKLVCIPGQVVYLHDTIANCAYLYVPTGKMVFGVVPSKYAHRRPTKGGLSS